MSTQDIIFLILGILILCLVATNVFLIVYSRRANKKIDILLEKGKIKDFKDIFLGQKEKSEELEGKIKEAFLRIDNVDAILAKTIQKTGLVRFNPFNAVGGNQSFTIALLDEKNNGFIISSLFVQEGNRVYAKTIKDGKSDHALSAEEKEAIEKAINYQK